MKEEERIFREYLIMAAINIFGKTRNDQNYLYCIALFKSALEMHI